MNFIKKNRVHIIYISILFFLFTTLANVTGKNSGLESKQRILKNVACSLEQADFESTLDSLTMPSDLKQMLGDNHVSAWVMIKKNIVDECYP